MTDPIICRHIGRSTWQGPASAAPRKEVRMTYDPEAAERERLRGQIAAIVAAYDRAMPMRTADWHGTDCDCLRCEIDRARAALASEPRA